MDDLKEPISPLNWDGQNSVPGLWTLISFQVLNVGNGVASSTFQFEKVTEGYIGGSMGRAHWPFNHWKGTGLWDNW